MDKSSPLVIIKSVQQKFLDRDNYHAPKTEMLNKKKRLKLSTLSEFIAYFFRVLSSDWLKFFWRIRSLSHEGLPVLESQKRCRHIPHLSIFSVYYGAMLLSITLAMSEGIAQY